MDERDYAGRDATSLAASIACGEVEPADVLDAAIARIERLNPNINAVVEKLHDAARADLAKLDRKAPFAGVPILIKDLHTLVQGSRLTHGSRFFTDHASDADSDIVRRFRTAGFIVIGRSNSPEFGINTATEGRFHGPALNPWDENRTPGGSSGGSAAAVASGMVPVAHATDSGGSIRIPASCCGLVGLKPTRGRVFAGLDAGEGWHDMFHAFALTRSVRDAAALLDCLANRSDPAPFRADGLAGSFADRAAQTGRRKLRIGVLDTPPSGVAVSAQVLEVLAKTVASCEARGHTVEEVSVSFDTGEVARAFMLVIAASVAATVDQREEATGRRAGPDDFESAVWSMVELGRSASAASLNRATGRLHMIGRDIATACGRFDLVLSPTLAQPPIERGILDAADPDLPAFLSKVFAFAPFTSMFNISGQPAISLPVGWSRDGLPVGMQFAAAAGREDLLVDIAFQLETDHPWRPRQEQLIAAL